MQQRCIGLTGGIATGKSTVSDYLKDRYQLPLADADVLAREAIAPGTAGFIAIVERFPHVLTIASELDRRQLGALIFRDEEQRRWLESLIHPYVRDHITQFLVEQQSAPRIVLDIPLLFEAGFGELATEIWVVVCEPSQQIERLRKRNPQLSEEEACERIRAQYPLAQKAAAADWVLDNSGEVDALYQQIEQILGEP
ncbi:MAG: dephospho-CoA kinase [Cyanobacteria bacterium P01_H01_bin.15]